MATLGGVIDNLVILTGRSDLATSLSATAKLAITRAIEHYEGNEFWFNESRITISCSSTVAEYTLSASVVSVMKVTITRNGTTYPIEQISEQERLSFDTTTVRGTPSWYSIYGGAFIPYPSPNDSYTANIACLKKPTTLSVTTDTNVFLTHAEQLIEARAGWWLSQFVFLDDAGAQQFKLLEANALDAVTTKSIDKQATGRITPTQF